jgi:hypothetical protein
MLAYKKLSASPARPIAWSVWDAAHQTEIVHTQQVRELCRHVLNSHLHLPFTSRSRWITRHPVLLLEQVIRILLLLLLLHTDLALSNALIRLLDLCPPL